MKFCKRLFHQRPLVHDQKRQTTLTLQKPNQQNEYYESPFPSNFIKTSKYTLIDFCFKALALQFTRYANIYFLIIAVLQCIPTISPLNPFSAIAPLVFVLGLSMLREGIEDYSRHQSDTEVNATIAKVIQNDEELPVAWADIEVGDLIIVEENEAFCADLIVLGSAIESGACYIETSSLDGEKNLKPRSALKESQALFSSRDKLIQQTMVTIFGDVPNPKLEEFDGAIAVNQKKITINYKQMLLRGAVLRNTKWILGAVIYTGQDTKIMRNAEPGRNKTSNVEMLMNKMIMGILFMQFACCLISATISSAWMQQQATFHWYLGYSNLNTNLQAFINFFTYFLLYNTMIPISLIVSLEFVKVFQAYFIEKDEEMYCKQRDKYVKVQTSSINEELGQVEYIFSDKTGTLTCNQMEFKYCIIADVLYGDKQNQTPVQQKEGRLTIYNFSDDELKGIIKKENKKMNDSLPIELKSNDGKAKYSFKTRYDYVSEFFILLSSAHECVMQKNEKTGDFIYQGPSPDEITLVDAAMNLGYSYIGSSASTIELEVLCKVKKIELLYKFEFNSTRKRMSCIIKDGDNYKMYIKGADSIIRSRLKGIQNEQALYTEQPYLKNIEGKLTEFSNIGLRTLLMATKIISKDEYEQFANSYNSLLENPNKDELLDKLIDQIERNLFVIGATAVEDKLQEKVPETIADLLRANIKVWMLTGDKMETAENIAKSCRLIQEDFELFKASEKNPEVLLKMFTEYDQKIQTLCQQKQRKCLLIEGESLAVIFATPQVKQLMLSFSPLCESVVCCRVSPAQKAQVVNFIKVNLNKITLAIGDGANDVNMIQEAHIGVGLYGNEGMRAVQSSDYALGQFSCLHRLILVHGHWSYIRISELILYFFYKNMAFTVIQFYFSFWSAYSGQSIFDDWYLTFYNLVFTALPLIIRASFDQDVNYRIDTSPFIGNTKKLQLIYKENEEVKYYFPNLYYVGQQNKIFNIQSFVLWVLQGALHGLIIYYLVQLSFDYKIISSDGQWNNLWAMSITLYSAVIIVVDVKLAVHTHLWTLANAIALFVFSILLYYGYVVISEYLGTQVADTPLTLMRSPNYWLVIILVSIIVWSIDQALNSYHKFKDLSFKSAMRKFHINFIKLLYKKKEITSEHLKKIIVLVKWQGESFLIGKKLLQQFCEGTKLNNTKDVEAH